MSSIQVLSPDSLTERKHIGRGQFGDVYKAKYKDLRIHVAVKQLKEHASYRLRELLAEAEKIKHASQNHFVVRLIGIVNTPPCIVMELAENGCLGKLMERIKEIPWPLKYRIIFEVSVGMNWLHSLSPPLLHLDLKPRNVLLNDALHIRITDFGLSKYISSSKVIGNNDDDIGGTLAYMPPEAFQEGYSPSVSTDVYSFAILSAVVLRGEDPYPVPCSALISINIPQGQRPSFESLENISYVKNLDKAIEFTKQCWHNDKQKRPSFDECCNQWEKFKSAYEKEILTAVTAVQAMLNDSSDSSYNITDVQQSASIPNTGDVSDMIRYVEALRIAEPPSAMLEAVPPAANARVPVQQLPPANQQRPNTITHAPSTPNYRPGTQPVRSSQMIPRQHSGPLRGQAYQTAQSGFNHRANSSVYRTETQSVRNPQNLQRHYNGPPPGQVHQTGQSAVYHRANSSGYWTRNVGNPQRGSHVYGWTGSGQTYLPMGSNMFLPPNMPMPYGHSAVPVFLPSSFQYPQLPPTTPGKQISINNIRGPCQIGDNNSMAYGVTRQHQTTLHNPMTQNPGWARVTPTQSANITVTDSNGPIQIGNNNAMFVTESSQYQGPPNTIHIAPQSGQSAQTSYLTPANSVRTPQYVHTSQVSFPTKEGEDCSDVTHPTQDTEKQTDQAQETIQATTGNNSLPGKDSVDSSSSPREQGINS